MITETSAQLNKARAGSLLIKCRDWTDQTGVIPALMGGKLPPRGREGGDTLWLATVAGSKTATPPVDGLAETTPPAESWREKNHDA